MHAKLFPESNATVTAFEFLISSANGQNIRIGELAHVVAPSKKSSRAAFVCGLAHVLSVGRKMKMIWPNTATVRNIPRRIIAVARMANLKSCRNWSKVNHPTRSVCVNIIGNGAADMDVSVPLGVSVCRPEPASVGFINLRPESCENGSGKSLIGKKRIGMWGRFSSCFSLVNLRMCGNGIAHSSFVAAYGLLALRGTSILSQKCAVFQAEVAILWVGVKRGPAASWAAPQTL